MASPAPWSSELHGADAAPGVPQHPLTHEARSNSPVSPGGHALLQGRADVASPNAVSPGHQSPLLTLGEVTCWWRRALHYRGVSSPPPQLQSTRCQRYTPPFVRTKNVCGLCQMSPRGKIAPDWESQFWVRIQRIFIRHNSYLNECACPCTHSVTHTTTKEKAGAAGV